MRALGLVLAAIVAAIPAFLISEIHYDNDGNNSIEAVEFAGPSGADLIDWQASITAETGPPTPQRRSRARSATSVARGLGFSKGIGGCLGRLSPQPRHPGRQRAAAGRLPGGYGTGSRAPLPAEDHRHREFDRGRMVPAASSACGRPCRRRFFCRIWRRRIEVAGRRAHPLFQVHPPRGDGSFTTYG